MSVYAGIDLHSNNNVLAVLDELLVWPTPCGLVSAG